MISGLNMTEAVPLSSKMMILLATPIMFAAAVTMSCKGVAQILRDGKIRQRSRCGLLREKDGIFDDWLKARPHNPPSASPGKFVP